ncbi:MAG: hemolysin family protein [Deltaproteobacteria bacterium]|jgi:CBS domain containing-hemolysin-like protein|nr:hemolysin family protein [Deltaproteobacteria bacterium]
MNTVLMLLAAMALVLLNALFVAAEFAFVRVRATRLELLAQSGKSGAKVAMFGLTNLEDYLSVCQLGITLASLGLGWLGEPAVAALLRPTLAFFGLTNPTLVHSLSIVCGFVFITFIHVTFGELAPKNLSIRGAETTVLFLAYPMRLFHLMFLPAVKVLNFAARIILYCLGASKLNESAAHSTQELKLLIAESKTDGQLDENEERLINNIFNLDRRTARDIMVHRTKVVAISATATPKEAIKLIRDHGFTRLPVYRDSKDNPEGFIHAKDLLLSTQTHDFQSLIRPALYIYDHMLTDDILEMMRQKRTRLGLVWDEYGSWQGLLTMEDILEAIVGEIQDEFDHEEPPVINQPDGSVIAQTTVSLEELSRSLPLELGPDSEVHYRTLAAILADKFGELPKAGDSWEGYGAKFTVAALDGPVVSKVVVSSLTPDPNKDTGKDTSKDTNQTPISE